MARMRHWIGLAAISLTLAGCVPQEKYEALKLDDAQLREQLGKSQTETLQAQALAEGYKQQLAMGNNASGNRDAIITNLTSQNANLQAQLDALNQKYAEAMSTLGKAGSQALPAPLSNALSDFAEKNPDLVEFDPARGVVKFKSDVTFAVGDATVTPKAKDAIRRFASILNADAAHGYELMVAGHTDNTPVANPETIRKGNKNNWYLSCHRAIAVNEELMADGVSARRLGAVGYADQRPIASNATEAGKAQNRRVEVLILPTTVHSSAPAVAEAPVTHHKSHATPRPPVFNKDTVSTDRQMINK